MPRVLPVVALATSALLLLVGCSPEPEPVATPTSAPTVEPSPTAEAAVRPNPVFALTCAEVFTVAEVQAVVTAPIEVKRDETSVPAEFWQLPLLADGALSCRWGGENRLGYQYTDGLDVDVLPGGSATFSSLVTGGFVQQVTVEGADEAVSTGCTFSIRADNGGAPGFCTIIARTGDRVVQLRFIDGVREFATEAAIVAATVPLVESAIARVSAAADVDQAWQAPTDTFALDQAFCDAAGAELLTSLGVETPFGGLGDPYFGEPRVRACDYFFGATDAASVSIWVVQGAAWAAGVEQTDVPEPGQPYEPQVTATGASWWLSPAGQAIRGRGAIDGSLIEVIVFWGDIGISVDQAQAGVTAFMEQYAEAPLGT